MAKEQCQDPKNIGAWLPILRSYLPGLLAQCDHQRHLAEEFAARSLEQHMFANDDRASEKAKQTAAWFADFKEFRSHGRRVSREDARAQGLNVTDLEDDDDLQHAVLSVHHAVEHTLSGTGTGKLIENQHGRAWIKMTQVIQMVPVQAGGPRPLPGGLPGAVPGLPQPNRAERRRRQRGK